MKLEKNFNRAKVKITQSQEKALNEIGIMLTAEAQTRAPVDTGRLRRDLGHNVNGDTVDIGTNVEYAPAVELGTSRQKAQPFLKDSFTRNIDKIKEIIIKNMSDI